MKIIFFEFLEYVMVLLFLLDDCVYGSNVVWEMNLMFSECLRIL